MKIQIELICQIKKLVFVIYIMLYFIIIIILILFDKFNIQSVNNDKKKAELHSLKI